MQEMKRRIIVSCDVKHYKEWQSQLLVHLRRLFFVLIGASTAAMLEPMKKSLV